MTPMDVMFLPESVAELFLHCSGRRSSHILTVSNDLSFAVDARPLVSRCTLATRQRTKSADRRQFGVFLRTKDGWWIFRKTLIHQGRGAMVREHDFKRGPIFASYSGGCLHLISFSQFILVHVVQGVVADLKTPMKRHRYLEHCLGDYGRGHHVYLERLDSYLYRSQLPALEEKVWEWSKEHPVIWNAGIGPTASFVPTLTRLLLERTTDICGPYDHIIRVRLPSPSAVAASGTTVQHELAFAVLIELARTLKTPVAEDIKQLAADESYFGYCSFSDNLMLQAFGQGYISLFGSARPDPIYDRQPQYSSILVERIREALQGKRHLLLVENLHVPISLDVLVYVMGRRWPSVLLNRRWLISSTSKAEKSRCSTGRPGWRLHLTTEYYYAPPFNDLYEHDWAVLIKEALRDAARSICMALKDKGDERFCLQVAQRCLYYGILYHPLQEVTGSKVGNASAITSDELVRCWVAEDLLFLTRSPYNTAAAIGKKQSNYYMSSYEAGKIVIQALQEYSLLPIFSVSSTTISTSSTQDVITGMSKLAEGVPRLKDDEVTHLKESNQLRWVSFMNDDGRHVSWNWRPWQTRGDTMMTTLILRSYSNISIFPLDKLFTPHLRVLDLSYTPINSLHPSFSNLLNLYLLSLRGCSQLETLTPPPSSSEKHTSPLAHLENLEVLDMNGVPLIELTQQDGSNKSNLHYLDISGSKFTTLPSEFFYEMLSLEELIFGNCTNLKELPSSMSQLLNLLVLHIEGTQITSFPEDTFKAMQSLHTLKLINNMLLQSLPRSLSEVNTLQVLHLSNCISLRTFPSSLSKAKCLKELHISNCISLMLQNIWELLPFLEYLYLQTWEGLEDIKISGHPNLTNFSISGPWVRWLSLPGCRKLKSVDFNEDLTALEDVDLSGTAIEEVPHNLPNLPQLNLLLLLDVPSFKRFPWHQLFRFPKVFYFDHCANDGPKMICQQKLTYGDENQQTEETTNKAHIQINDTRMFHSFSADTAKKLVKEGHFLQSFAVQVKPCSERSKKPRHNEVGLRTRMQRHSTYGDVQYSEASSIVPMKKLQPMQRHVEISAVNQYPNGLRHVLSVTNSIFITDDAFVRCLTDLNYNLNELEECQLQRCHQMTVIFLMQSEGSGALPYLQILQVFDLNNLLCVVEPSDLSYSNLLTLKLLKHIHLERCPRLEKMFPCSLSLPALETLVVLFCSNLKTIFYKQPDQDRTEVALSPLPKIRKIFLQELPQLLHIHGHVTFRFETPNLEKLFVRGCQSFERLPLLKKEYLKSKVEVSGEREWWGRLHLKLPEQSDYYLHVAPPEFVSRKKHITESYLR